MVLFVVFLLEPHIWETSCYWDMGQNAFSQSDGRTLKSTISLEQIDKIAWFFACSFGGHGQKWWWPVWLHKSKIDRVSRMNKLSKLIYSMLVQIQESWKLPQWFFGGVQKQALPFSWWDPKICCNLRMNFCWFFACWYWCNNSWLDWSYPVSLTFKCWGSTAVVPGQNTE